MKQKQLIYFLATVITFPICTIQDNAIGDFSSKDEIKLSIQTHLSTKTPYDYVANKNTTLNIAFGEGCHPVQVWLVFRHGTRYPKKKQLRALKNDIPKLLEKLANNRDKVK